MKPFALTIAAVVAASFAGTVAAKPFDEMFPAYAAEFDAEAKALLDGLDYLQGEVTLKNGLATVDVGEDYYFLKAKDAQYVLEELWGNPPDHEVLGLLAPVEYTPLHSGSWSLIYSFEDIGYVSDEDAESYDYDSLLETMQADTQVSSAWRVENGYESISLVGWAETPKYNRAERSLYWAQELDFGDVDTNTLNFNVRRLGRKGVLVQNFVADISVLPQVKQNLTQVIAMTKFGEGHRYVDFDPSVDKVAAVGIGGLIAGKVLAKSGFLALALVFLKKFWFLAFLPLIWLKNLIFNRTPKDQS